jgi:hypothetical protein
MTSQSEKFVFGLALGLITATSALAQSADAIPYPTVAAALEGLRTKSGVNVRNEAGFTVIEDARTMAIWTFTAAGHAAHPAVVRRGVVQRGNDIFVDMQVKCEAAKPACDKLTAEFQALTEQMRQSLNRGRAR